MKPAHIVLALALLVFAVAVVAAAREAAAPQFDVCPLCGGGAVR